MFGIEWNGAYMNKNSIMLFAILLIIFLSGCNIEVPVCGDGLCVSGIENDGTNINYCPQDCEPETDSIDLVCGDGVCVSGVEDSSVNENYCPQDCIEKERKPGELPPPELLPDDNPQCQRDSYSGPCKAKLRRYFFDNETGMCREFDWGGCADVEPFRTLEECQRRCEYQLPPEISVSTEKLFFSSGEQITLTPGSPQAKTAKEVIAEEDPQNYLGGIIIIQYGHKGDSASSKIPKGTTEFSIREEHEAVVDRLFSAYGLSESKSVNKRFESLHESLIFRMETENKTELEVEQDIFLARAEKDPSLKSSGKSPPSRDYGLSRRIVLYVDDSLDELSLVKRMRANEEDLGEFIIQEAYVEELIELDRVPDDPRFSTQWGLQDFPGVSAPLAWDIEMGNPNIKIAVLDSGLYYYHEDLQNNIWLNQAEIKADNGQYPPRLIDSNGNGIIDPEELLAVIGDWDQSGTINLADALVAVLENPFVNGVDEDGDGLADNLLGWDFTNIPSISAVIDYCHSADPDAEDYFTVDNDPLTTIDRHGTFIAGIAAAVTNNATGIAGTCPECSIMPLRVGYALNNGCQGGTDGYIMPHLVEQALYYAVEHGADIVNMSFGNSSSSRYSHAAITMAHDNGVLLIATAGNNDRNERRWPASFPEVMSVAATDDSGRRAHVDGFWGSNWHSDVEISAPGKDVYSTITPSFSSLYNYGSGTSYSAPRVAGVAGLVKSYNPELTNEQIRQVLISTSTPVIPPVGHVDGQPYPLDNAGIVNAQAALRSIYEEPPRLPSLLSNPNGSGMQGTLKFMVIFFNGSIWVNYGEEHTEEITIPLHGTVELAPKFSSLDIRINDPGKYRVYSEFLWRRGVISSASEFMVE